MDPLKVSQSVISPVRYPVVNHFWRWADYPWVQASRFTRPWNFFWM